MELIKYNKLKQIFLAKIKDIKTKGFSLVEVLVSLAIISSAILIILTSVARATQRATLNKLHAEMINSAGTLLTKTQNVLYQKYKDENWDTLLNGYIQLKTENDELIIQPTNISCVPTQNPLSQECPSLDIISSDLNHFAYIINAQPAGPNNVYKLTITVACKEGTKCNADKILPVKSELYVVKY